MKTPEKWHGTTVVSVRKGKEVVARIYLVVNICSFIPEWRGPYFGMLIC